MDIVGMTALFGLMIFIGSESMLRVRNFNNDEASRVKFKVRAENFTKCSADHTQWFAYEI